MNRLHVLLFITGGVVGSAAAFVAGALRFPSDGGTTWEVPTANADAGGAARGRSPSRLATARKDAALSHELGGALAGTGAQSLADVARRAARGDGSTRGWSALLTLYAMGDRTEDFLRAAPDALT